MGCNGRGKPQRGDGGGGRKSRSSTAAAVQHPAVASAVATAHWTEDHVEDLILNHLDIVYKEALARLVSLGHSENLALKAILRGGHCYGSNDVISNIVENSLSFLNNQNTDLDAAGFSDLRHLEEYSLAGMVCLLQQLRPDMTRADALWCLLMADLHVGCASTLEIPCGIDELPKGKIDILENANANESVDVVGDVLRDLEKMSIREEKEDINSDSSNNDRIMDLVKQIRELEVQVNERKEWARQKALQAAKKLSNDLAELKNLRLEKEENQSVKKGKQTLEDSTLKKLSDMEANLRKASGNVDRANMEVRRLETENAEIRAEMEASKLNAAESSAACLEIARREKRCLKKLIAWEKQREKMQEGIAEERRKILQMQRQLDEVKEAQKQTETIWKQEIKSKERAVALAEEERRVKEAVEANVKQRHESLRRKIDLDFQRHKDDIQRLEDELSRLRTSTELNSQKSLEDLTKTNNEQNHKTPRKFPNKSQQASSNIGTFSRECVICMKEEVSVVFLPCAHQILCASCNEQQETRGESNCPCCNSRINQRIRVYGASS